MKLIAVIAVLHLAAHTHAREHIATSDQFAFYSDFETNLNDALIAAGVARERGHDALFTTGSEQACFEALAPSAQAGWRLAVSYYAEIISPHSFNDRQQYLIRLSLAGMGSKDPRSAEYLDLAASLRRAAAPAYKGCRWAAQDSLNRGWIDGITSQLSKHESELATRLAKHYQQPWSEQRLVVDAVATVSWAGANSFFIDNSSGHLLISSDSTGHEALETLFHEASHGFMLRPSPLQDALKRAAKRLGVQVPDGLWHVVLFYTTGETVRTVVETAGEAAYEPMIYGIYSRSKWGDYQGAMDATWPSYMAGKKSDIDAATELIKQINGL